MLSMPDVWTINRLTQLTNPEAKRFTPASLCYVIKLIWNQYSRTWNLYLREPLYPIESVPTWQV